MREKQDLEQNYAEAVTEGDQKFKGRNYEGAKKAFERAASLKPDEAYPPEQLAAINQAVEDEKKRMEEEALAAQQAEEEARRQQQEKEANQEREEFNRIVKLGDELMAEKEYKNAKIRYTEALEVIPEDPDGLLKLTEADRLLNEMLKTRDLDKQYNMVIADADAAYNAGDYANAQIRYREALEVKPDETYPAQRISEIDELLAEERGAR
jgi:tetratricopeptide (TPR) repeat protein